MEDLPGETDYIQEPFAKDRTLIVAAPDHPLAGKEHVRFEDLKKENFLLREKGAGVRDRFEAILRTKDCVIDPLWESRSTKVLVQAVEDGFGISVLPYCLIEEYLKEGRLAEIKVEDLCLERNLNLALQILEITKNVIVCVNLMDEARKKKIIIDSYHFSNRYINSYQEAKYIRDSILEAKSKGFTID